MVEKYKHIFNDETIDWNERLFLAGEIAKEHLKYQSEYKVWRITGVLPKDTQSKIDNLMWYPTLTKSPIYSLINKMTNSEKIQ